MSFRSSLLFLVVTALAAVRSAHACIFCPFLPKGMIPTQCYDQLQEAGECFVQRNCRRCLAGAGAQLNSASRVGAVIDNFFYMPVDADTCAEFEEPICPLTQECCSSCRGRINSLYRCMVRNSNGMSARSVELQRTCALDCRGSSTMGGGTSTPGTPRPRPTMGPQATPAPEVDASEDGVNGTEPVYIGENATDTNVTEPVYVAESNATDPNMADPVVVADGRVSALRGADFGY